MKVECNNQFLFSCKFFTYIIQTYVLNRETPKVIFRKYNSFERSFFFHFEKLKFSPFVKQIILSNNDGLTLKHYISLLMLHINFLDHAMLNINCCCCFIFFHTFSKYITTSLISYLTYHMLSAHYYLYFMILSVKFRTQKSSSLLQWMLHEFQYVCYLVCLLYYCFSQPFLNTFIEFINFYYRDTVSII